MKKSIIRFTTRNHRFFTIISLVLIVRDGGEVVEKQT